MDVCILYVLWGFYLEEELSTPPLDGLILPGITRQSILDRTRKWVRKERTTHLTFGGIKQWWHLLYMSNPFSQDEFKVTERYLTMAQFCSALKQQRVKELFGSGTACMICPVGHIHYQGEVRQRNSVCAASLCSSIQTKSNDFILKHIYIIYL